MPKAKSKKILKRILYAFAAAVTGAIILAAILIHTVFPTKYVDTITQQAQKYNIDQTLIYAVIWTESKFDSDAQSAKGARGVMQLLPSTARWCADELDQDYYDDRLLDAEFNIKLGVFYLAYLMGKYDEKEALAAYNAGEGNVQKWNGEIKFKETRDYIKRVEFARKVYRIKSK